MKVDTHYYAVLGFARAVGFKKEFAVTIAYASQFVDDALINHMVLREKPSSQIKYDIIDGQPCFFNMATCHNALKFKTFNYNSMINNTAAFHFVPGCDGILFPKKLRCKENREVIQQILEDVMTFKSPSIRVISFLFCRSFFLKRLWYCSASSCSLCFSGFCLNLK